MPCLTKCSANGGDRLGHDGDLRGGEARHVDAPTGDEVDRVLVTEALQLVVGEAKEREHAVMAE